MQVWRSFLAIVAVALGVTSSRADVIIDDFSLPNPAANVNLPSAPGSSFSTTDSVPGASRDIFVFQTANLNNTNPATNIVYGTAPTGNIFAMSTTTGTSSHATLTYTFTSPVDLVAISATDVQFTLNRSDQMNVPYSLTIAGTSSLPVTINGLLPGAFSATNITNPLSAFSAAGLDGVTSVSLTVNTGSAIADLDITLSDFRFLAPTPPPGGEIPAPPAVFLLMAALPALGFRKVREKLGLAKA